MAMVGMVGMVGMGAGLLENSPPVRSGWAEAGAGSVMLVVLNRSSSSFRAEYLSPLFWA